MNYSIPIKMSLVASFKLLILLFKVKNVIIIKSIGHISKKLLCARLGAEHFTCNLIDCILYMRKQIDI